MIVTELNVVGIAVSEAKANAPLIVDGNRVLAGAIASERMQAVAGRHPEIGDLGGCVHGFKLAHSPAGDIRRHPLGLAGAEQLLGGLVREGLDHHEV